MSEENLRLGDYVLVPRYGKPGRRRRGRIWKINHVAGEVAVWDIDTNTDLGTHQASDLEKVNKT